ncbi:MAG: substrate-binding domain-containing protein [Cytophagaceae bacterium]|nr:substrate-binding domain-containing protein [Cytophagaceae bacterium]
MKQVAYIGGVLILASGLLACGDSDKPADTVSTGDIVIASDQSLQPLIEAEEMAFEASRKYAKITPKYVTELKAIEMLLNDSARVAVVTREFNARERKILAEQKFQYRSMKIAIDAVALITNDANADTLISTDQLRDVLTGKITQWNQLRRGGKQQTGGGKITVVFDNNSSSNLSYLLDTLEISDQVKAPVFAVKSNEEVIAFVKKNPNAMGVIGLNWISDSDDPKTPGFMQGIRVMGVARRPEPEPEDYFQPFQYNLALNRYPLSRNVLMITKEARRGLGTGFINYVASDRGQRIVLKAGLLPATQIIRLVNIRPE